MAMIKIGIAVSPFSLPRPMPEAFMDSFQAALLVAVSVAASSAVAWVLMRVRRWREIKESERRLREMIERTFPICPAHPCTVDER
jgi:hypothetical protein